MLARGGRTRQASRHCAVPEHATIKDFAPAPRVLWDSCWERAGGRRQGGRGGARPSLACVTPGRAEEERSRARPWRGQWGTATHLHRRPPLTVRRTGNKREFPGISGKDCARGADIRESVAHNAWPRHILARATWHSATHRAKRRRFTTPLRACSAAESMMILACLLQLGGVGLCLAASAWLVSEGPLSESRERRVDLTKAEVSSRSAKRVRAPQKGVRLESHAHDIAPGHSMHDVFSVKLNRGHDGQSVVPVAR
jgi:hypothetical protein